MGQGYTIDPNQVFYLNYPFTESQMLGLQLAQHTRHSTRVTRPLGATTVHLEGQVYWKKGALMKVTVFLTSGRLKTDSLNFQVLSMWIVLGNFGCIWVLFTLKTHKIIGCRFPGDTFDKKGRFIAAYLPEVSW